MEAVARDGARVSMTALNMHTACFDRVRQYQFLQETPGELVLRIVPGSTYGPADAAGIAAELAVKLGDGMRVTLCEVEEIPRTEGGKWKFLVQKLPEQRGTDILPSP